MTKYKTMNVESQNSKTFYNVKQNGSLLHGGQIDNHETSQHWHRTVPTAIEPLTWAVFSYESSSWEHVVKHENKICFKK